VDWNPTPADKDSGIWKEVSLTMSGPVAIRHPFVSFEAGCGVQIGGADAECGVAQRFGAAAKGTFSAEVDGKATEEPVELAAGETKVVRFDAATYPQLKLAAPKCGGRTRWDAESFTPRNFRLPPMEKHGLGFDQFGFAK